MTLELVTKEEFEELNCKIDMLIDYLKIKQGSDNDKLLNTKEAQEYLKVSAKTLQNYRDSGILSFSQIGRKIFFTKADLDDFLKQIKIK
jgi:excisionase family DNA binding protein